MPFSLLKMIIHAPVAPVLGFVVILAFSACATTGKHRDTSVDSSFESLLDAVVRIDVWETDFSGGAARTSRGVGSGVIMSESGYVLTNAHVVGSRSERIVITLNSLERVEGTWVGWDHWTDLAVVRLDMDEVRERSLKFAVAQFGDSSRLKPGDQVFAVGTPNGLSRTVSSGIVSNTDRYFEASRGVRGFETGTFNTWLQTDAAINPGNRGGPLVLGDGRVIGINTRGYLGANNLGFAVPSRICVDVMESLIAQGEKTRSYVGLQGAPLQDLESFFRLEMNQGVLVESADPGSPAANQDLRAGDIILSVYGQLVEGRFPEQVPGFQNEIAELSVGSEVSMRVLRSGQEKEIKLTTEPLESRFGEEDAVESWGIAVRDITRRGARIDRLETDDGVQVTSVQNDYPAERAGIRSGDIILKVNRESITDLDELHGIVDAVAQETDGDKVLFEVMRGIQVRYVVMEL